MGFCNSEDVLLGKCKIDEQLPFLSLLTLFIKRTFSAKSESLKYDKETANNLLKTNLENVSPNIVCGSDERNNLKNETTPQKDSEPSAQPINTMDQRKSNFESMCSSIKLNLEELNRHQTDDYEPKLQNFYTSFKNITSLPVENSQSNRSFDDYHDLQTDIEQIHTTFSTINKALVNEVEFNNRLVPESTEKTAKPLSSVIRNNLVLIEQACNMLKENQVSS